MKPSRQSVCAIAVILLVLAIDQTLKIAIKTSMTLSESIDVTDWFKINFVENNGIAMGIDVFNKKLVSLFRILACFAIAWYIVRLIRKRYSVGYIICISLIFTGAIGNIIDSVFYGVIFSESTTTQVAALFPSGGGYSTWLHGKVVDMFYFPLFRFTWASWIPVIGGGEFEFFRWVFNIADASISVGFGILILFYRKTFSLSFEKHPVEK
ncbi:MAG: lipoprotein signal peptidase [Dysgonamonadaceae bacterium]|jgi:signal peptidase II|nr:lipoprotein signal peptidase [Dysgonamonadaceae bacterium]